MKLAWPFNHAQIHGTGGTDPVYADGGHTNGLYLPAYDEACIQVTGVAVASGTIYLSYVTANRNLTINNILLMTAATASSASGQTLIKAGVYSVDASGNFTLAGASANVQASGVNILGGASNVAALQAVNSLYQFPLSAPVGLLYGVRYAYAILVVQAASNTLPVLKSAGPTIGLANAFPYRKSGSITGQTDLAGSYLTGSFAASGNRYWLAGQA
jgi:hypothetical protein